MPNLDALALAIGHRTLGLSLPEAMERVAEIFPDAIASELADCPPIIKFVSLRLRGVSDPTQAALAISDRLSAGFSLLDAIALLPEALRLGTPYLRG